MLYTTVVDGSVAKFTAGWKDLDPGLLRSIDSGTAITTDRMAFNYYFKRYPDFVLGLTDVPGEKIITSFEEFAEVVHRHSDVSLVTYRAHFYDESWVNVRIREYVEREFERVDDGQDDRRIMVYRARR